MRNTQHVRVVRKERLNIICTGRGGGRGEGGKGGRGGRGGGRGEGGVEGGRRDGLGKREILKIGSVVGRD